MDKDKNEEMKDDVVNRLMRGMLSPGEAKILLTRYGASEEDADFWINDIVDGKLVKIRSIGGL
jgi:hypothetical protein|tara:strand:- start:111 stop:299 length:189 start_codon:yes stop_codon:yes gene_type:complete